MGGRGGSSGLASNVPRLNNPAGIPKNAMTEQEFLALRGVGDAMSGYTVDKLRGNRQLGTYRGKAKFDKEVSAASTRYQQSRESARDEYKRLVDRGVIRDKTPLERRLTAAHGHPDNQATQAARRLLEKQGIDWRTGKKKKRR